MVGDGRFERHRACGTQGSIGLLQETGETNDLARAQMRRDLRRAMEDSVTPRQRELLLLRYEEGLSHVAIARRLGLDPSSVSRTVRRGERNLRRCLRFARYR